MSVLFDDSSSEYLKSSTVLISGTYTFAAWIDPDASVDMVITSTADEAVANHFERIQLNRTGPNLKFEAVVNDGGTERIAQSSGNLSINTWVHIAAKITSAERRIYINGVDEGNEGTSVTPAGLDNTLIGGFDDGTAADFFSGRIAHCAWWDVALTAAEILSLANGVNPFNMRVDRLKHYVPLNGQSPEYDIISQKTLTLNGTPVVAEEPPKLYRTVIAP